MKLDHVGVPVTDMAKSKTFYDAVLGVLGARAGMGSVEEHYLGYFRPDAEIQESDASFWLSEGAPGHVHVCFAVGDRETVEKFHAAGLAAGGKDNGPPGIRKDYSPGYYAAFVLDPDGHNVEAVFHDR